MALGCRAVCRNRCSRGGLAVYQHGARRHYNTAACFPSLARIIVPLPRTPLPTTEETATTAAEEMDGTAIPQSPSDKVTLQKARAQVMEHQCNSLHQGERRLKPGRLKSKQQGHQVICEFFFKKTSD